MTGKNKFYFWTIWATAVLLFIFYLYSTSDIQSFAQQMTTIIGTLCWSFLIYFISQHYPVIGKSWKRMGPDYPSLAWMSIPFYVPFHFIIQHWVVSYVVENRVDLLNIKSPITNFASPPFLLFLALFLVYGILTSFVRRLRWNSEGIDYRDMFFESRFLRWDEIDRVELGGSFIADELRLKDGSRVMLAKLAGRAGLDQFKTDARAKGVEIVAAKGRNEATIQS